MSQFDDYPGSAAPHKGQMSAESFVAALAANVGQMNAEAFQAYVRNTLPLVGYPKSSGTAGASSSSQFGDH